MRIAALLSTILLAVVAGCGGAQESEQATSTETSASPAVPSTGSQLAPAIEGVTLEGERLSLADFRGRPVFVNVWSSW